MASIFTYEPDTPRVASPWIWQGTENQNVVNHTSPTPSLDAEPTSDHVRQSSTHRRRQMGRGIYRLRAEPQEGPVEYKLHLLLRPRRRYKSTSTSGHIPGSKHSAGTTNVSAKKGISEGLYEHEPVIQGAETPPAASSHQSRQHRLEQLTTQLLWRLQQSSPHHSSSATNLILPSLPEALPELQAPQQPAKLLHGLEESQGALYEIGVADDGTLVGLAEDEMDVSLNNLRAMAGCLGCTVEVLRSENVGECEWLDESCGVDAAQGGLRASKLLVVEAFVKPHLQSDSVQIHGGPAIGSATSVIEHTAERTTEQLRITLAGPTMSGKSTILGTLTTSTLDNGRGKSRLSMLKHRHEISTGITSSVNQELLGYRDGGDGSVEVVNYARENTASWIDVHVAAAGSRLIFISDSAGHPRFRRTLVRSLVGWAPHWTLMCWPADAGDSSASDTDRSTSSYATVGTLVSDAEISIAQLELCLRLRLPLVIVITKLDLASKSALRSSLTKILDTLKAWGRRPAILASPNGEINEHMLQSLEAPIIDAAYKIALPLLNDAIECVPIVLTSAVQGTGVRSLHALLHELPLPNMEQDRTEVRGILFHIEEIFTKPAEAKGIVISGRLRRGSISVGDEGCIGPFDMLEFHGGREWEDKSIRRSAALPTSRSFPGAFRNDHLQTAGSFQGAAQGWRQFKVASIRNLRLPVHTLLPDQVGTLAIVPNDNTNSHSDESAAFTGLRKGMVLTSRPPVAARSFAAQFHRDDLESLAVGNHVVVYVASVRASARIVSARVPDSPDATAKQSPVMSTTAHPFDFEGVHASIEDEVIHEAFDEKVAGQVTAHSLLVRLDFDAAREFIMVGDQVLVMPGGGPGLYIGSERGEKGVAGLEGFVGEIIEIIV